MKVKTDFKWKFCWKEIKKKEEKGSQKRSWNDKNLTTEGSTVRNERQKGVLALLNESKLFRTYTRIVSVERYSQDDR